MEWERPTHTKQRGGQILEAAIARSSTEGVAPAVLVVHQWSGRGEGEDRAIERLPEAGYVGIAIDVYGKGANLTVS